MSVRNGRRRGRGPRPRRRVLTAGAGLLGAYLGALAVDRSRVVVDGRSMEPTLTAGEVVLTWPLAGRRRWLVRPGRVVVLRDPADADHLVVKRVHAIGDAGIDVRGDEPDRSTDSRHYGPVERTALRAVVLVRWPDVFSPLHHRRA